MRRPLRLSLAGLSSLPVLLAGLAAVVLSGCGGTALSLVDGGPLGFCGLLHLIAVVWAFVQIANSRADQGSKVLWGLAVFFFPVIGLIAWYFAGPKR